MAETRFPSAAGRVAALWRHPVKGFTPEPLEAAGLPTGGWFPGDRMFAVEDGPSGFDRAAPEHLAKAKFTVLMRTAEVAGVRTRWDEAARTLHAAAAGQSDLAVAVDDPGDRAVFEAWLAAVLGDAVSGPLKLVSAEGLDHRFMDHPLGRVSILNLASVRDFESRVGRPVDPLRFRANLYVEGWPAWRELDLVGKTLRIGDARLKTVKDITRCAATNVDPVTAERDLNIPDALMRNFGHINCGVYAEVIADGAIAAGDPVVVEG